LQLESDHLEDAIYKPWRQGVGNPSGGTVPENVLENFVRPCYVCQKPGHNACPQKKNNPGGD